MTHQILSDVIDHKCKYLDIAMILPLKALFADRRFDRTSSPSAFRAGSFGSRERTHRIEHEFNCVFADICPAYQMFDINKKGRRCALSCARSPIQMR